MRPVGGLPLHGIDQKLSYAEIYQGPLLGNCSCSATDRNRPKGDIDVFQKAAIASTGFVEKRVACERRFASGSLHHLTKLRYELFPGALRMVRSAVTGATTRSLH